MTSWPRAASARASAIAGNACARRRRSAGARSDACKIRFPAPRRRFDRPAPSSTDHSRDAPPLPRSRPPPAASPSSACPGAPRRRCCAASTPTGSSSAPTSTPAPAASARCSPRTATAAAPTSPPSPAPGTSTPTPRRPRRATRREVATLRSLLEASLDLDTSLDQVSIAELAEQIRAERRQRAGHVEIPPPPIASPEPADAPIRVRRRAPESDLLSRDRARAGRDEPA